MKYIVLATALLSLFPGCHRERVIFVLLDTSGSVRPPELVDRYLDIVAEVVGTLEPGDRFLGDRISDKSVADARLALNVTIPAFSVTDNSYRYETVRDTAAQQARRQATDLFHARSAPCTDHLGALEVAARVLAGFPNTERRLLILSDMVSTCPLNMLRADLSDTAIASYIEEERNAGRLPDLYGVDVWVAGAGSDTRITRERRIAIERFWVAYFEASGATLTPERYGTTLLAWN